VQHVQALGIPWESWVDKVALSNTYTQVYKRSAISTIYVNSICKCNGRVK